MAPVQVAIAWQLARSPQMLPIPGTKSVEHLEENVAAASIELDEADLAELEVAEPQSRSSSARRIARMVRNKIR